VPVYGSELSLALARRRIEEAGLLKSTELVVVRDGERRMIGPFDCEFIPVTHSVPHGFATAFTTPAGVVVHTGDFKIDLTPVDGRTTDLATLGAIARRPGGVRLLLSDSTNAERPGHTPSERTVGHTIRDVLRDWPDRRFIVACFASHIHRVEQVAQAAIAAGRKVAFLGRSMEHNVSRARELGLLDVPTSSVIDIEAAGRLAPGDVCVICTGSQGEPMSALSLMAAREHKHVKISSDDVVVISAHAIPGNETSVFRVIDTLHRAGAEVIYGTQSGVHVSGHASQDELKFLLSLVSPEWFVPVHGEYRHLVHHARLATDVGIPPERVLLCEDGDSVVLGPAGAVVERRVAPAGYTYVDGIVGDVGGGVLRDRRALAEEGVVVVILTVDSHTGEVLNGPEIVTRGWVYAPEAEGLIEDAKAVVLRAVSAGAAEGHTDFESVRRHARSSLKRFINERTRRAPIIVPVVMEA
jgi:ribonuclease J